MISKLLPVAARVVLGLVFFVFGLNGAPATSSRCSRRPR
jgi:hypothetical protein